MKFGFKEIKIDMGIFDFYVICIIGDYRNCGKYIQWKFEDKDFNPEIWDKGYIPIGKVFSSSGYAPVLWIPRKPKTPREYATLAHEALHCVYHLFDWASIPMSAHTEEVATHSMAHIINEVLINCK
jgi:hypothetical protein